MRICFVTHASGRGGAELALLELLEGLISKGIGCNVLARKKGPFLDALDRLHVEWKLIDYPWICSVRHQSLPIRVIRIVKSFLLAIPMAYHLKKWQCDVVYSNTVTIGAGALAARLACRPHFWLLHELGHNFLFDLGEHRMANLMDRFSIGIIAGSHAVAKYYTRNIKPNKIRVIYQAVTLPDEEGNVRDLVPSNHNQLIQCIIVGALTVQKGQIEAIVALSEVVRRGVNAHLLIVGNGEKDFTSRLLQQVKDLGLEQRVKFYGYAENPITLIRAADVMLMCSNGEAHGRVTVEAMLVGKAVIGNASGGTTELIHDGETGLLYACGNHAQLADKIQYLYENPEERLKMGAAARIWAMDRFTQERYAREVITNLKEVFAGNP
jgi:glycosyltransferase involved in cell wall biosynthesis